MNLVGKRNAYRCDTCGKSIVTIDRDKGTTPFMIFCRATDGCKGMMESSFYSGLLANCGAPTFEWRKPTRDEYAAASKGMKEHFDMGGLDVKRIVKEEESA